MIYFAYGSNMNWTQLKGRCQSAAFFGCGCLRNHRLAFTRECSRGHGVADIVPEQGQIVWGVLYVLSELDLGKLDKAEGYLPNRRENAYVRCEISVLFEAKEDFPVTAWTYVVQSKSSKHIPPSNEYLGLIVEGAKYWHLPTEYVQSLKEIEVQR